MACRKQIMPFIVDVNFTRGVMRRRVIITLPERP